MSKVIRVNNGVEVEGCREYSKEEGLLLSIMTAPDVVERDLAVEDYKEWQETLGHN